MDKKQEKKLKKYIKRELRAMKRAKARCARTYPDWVDDEFNMLDNLFVWGYNTNPNTVPSFCSWDDICIYYNRANKKYYMILDDGYYKSGDPERECQRLAAIDEAFKDFLISQGQPMRASICFRDLVKEDEGAESLSELYVKFRVLYEGFKWYAMNKQ